MTDADAHGAERVVLLRALEVIESSGYETRSACAERVAKGDSAPVRIYEGCVVWKAKIAKDSEGLRRKRFVEFNDIHLGKKES